MNIKDVKIKECEDCPYWIPIVRGEYRAFCENLNKNIPRIVTERNIIWEQCPFINNKRGETYEK